LRVDHVIVARGVGAASVEAMFLGVPAWEHTGQAPLGHAPSLVQGTGKPRKPHAGAPSK
jgi:hypothetical protein